MSIQTFFSQLNKCTQMFKWLSLQKVTDCFLLGHQINTLTSDAKYLSPLNLPLEQSIANWRGKCSVHNFIGVSEAVWETWKYDKLYWSVYLSNFNLHPIFTKYQSALLTLNIGWLTRLKHTTSLLLVLILSSLGLPSLEIICTRKCQMQGNC